MRDNQNRDLGASKRWLEREAQNHAIGFARMIAEPAYPEWSEVEGIQVLRIENSRFVAVPNGARFDIIDLESRAFVCQVSKKGACKWLLSAETERTGRKVTPR
jgi:hypothetical protein